MGTSSCIISIIHRYGTRTRTDGAPYYQFWQNTSMHTVLVAFVTVGECSAMLIGLGGIIRHHHQGYDIALQGARHYRQGGVCSTVL